MTYNVGECFIFVTENTQCAVNASEVVSSLRRASCRPRTEREHVHGTHRRVVPSKSLRVHRCGSGISMGVRAWRRQRGCAAHAGRDWISGEAVWLCCCSSFHWCVSLPGKPRYIFAPKSMLVVVTTVLLSVAPRGPPLALAGYDSQSVYCMGF